jgi:MarR family transcriptional regulator for hemolysin
MAGKARTSNREINPSSLGFALKATLRLYSRNFERHASGLGLTLSQCRVLAQLSRSEGLSQARLAECTETDPMTLVRVLDRMEQEHWIERRPDPSDRRAYRIYLTADAKPVLARIAEVSEQTRLDATAGMSDEETARLLALLQRMQSNLSASDETHINPSDAAGRQ